ncbi:hypothetical protein [Sphingomonas paucimobilis]|uniref:hypothetical protein n=1 Tax=Sphingomonas paucimobilis TaxID=13689 RepID=UPI00064C0F94|nr:hypothetical protein [Sphingomonas paucimobilis]
MAIVVLPHTDESERQMSMGSADLIVKVIDMVEQSQQEIARLTAIQGLQNFVIFHLIENGGMGQLSDTSLDQLRQVIAMNRQMAAESSDPECLEPLVEMLTAVLPALDAPNY